jgi:tetratricopeptide (TPR) repeat protein
MIVAGFLFEKLFIYRKEIKSNILIKKLALVLGGLILMIFINPYGLMGVVNSLRVNTAVDFPIHSMEVSTIFRAIQTNPGWTNASVYVYLVLIVILAIVFIGTFLYRLIKKKPLFTNNFIFLFLASIGSAGLSYYIFRGLPLFGSIFLISICYLGNDFFLHLKNVISKEDLKIQKIIKYFLIALLIFTIIFLIFLSQKKYMQYQEQGIGLSKDALSSAEFFKEQELQGPIFNDTDSGSYLIGELYPQEKVFVDNRFGDAYSASFFSDIYLPMMKDENKWKEGMAKYNINTIFMYHYDMGESTREFIYRRIYDPEWVWVYVDKYNVIFVRNTLDNKKVIDRYRITFNGVPQRLKYLITSNIPKDKLIAADILNLVGRTDVSIPLYLQYLSLRPGNGEIWFILGRTELRKVDQSQSNPSLAAIYIEKAIKEGWTTWEAYSYLALAYYRTGQLERTKEMVKKEMKLVPANSKDLLDWQKAIADEELRIKNAE